MKKIIAAVLIIFVFGILVFFKFQEVLEVSAAKKVIITNQEDNDIIIDIELARTDTEHSKGLSGREKLPEGEGMLFVFEEKMVRNFWMKEMNFPLDIIWLDGEKIVKISRNLPPEGKQPTNHYSSGVAVDYVLEVPAGFCDTNKIKTGNSVFYKY
jgi:hypothetical protein